MICLVMGKEVVHSMNCNNIIIVLTMIAFHGTKMGIF